MARKGFSCERAGHVERHHVEILWGPAWPKNGRSRASAIGGLLEKLITLVNGRNPT